ncbi:MAG: hypothetical protein GX569_10585 [Candidatus Riflebacteria bacterium]|nr:hypothetical protein [Candidatus Riflebacteria bacterium]
MAKKVYVSETSFPVAFNVEVTCEACATVYSCRGETRLNHYDTSNKPLNPISFTERTNELHRELVYRILRSKENLALDYDLQEACPRCGYLQSWMQKRLIGEKAREELGAGSAGSGCLTFLILSAVVYSTGLGWPGYAGALFTGTLLGLAIYNFFEAPTFKQQEQELSAMNQAAGNPPARPPGWITFVNPVSEAYADSLREPRPPTNPLK